MLCLFGQQNRLDEQQLRLTVSVRLMKLIRLPLKDRRVPSHLRHQNVNGGRSCDRPPLRWAIMTLLLALLPNDVTTVPCVLQFLSLCRVSLPNRFSGAVPAWLADCEVRATAFAFAWPFRWCLKPPNLNRLLRHFIPLARSAWLRYRPFTSLVCFRVSASPLQWR